MPLKAIIDSVEGLDEAVQALYAQRPDGKYVLDVEGYLPGTVPKSELDEFRNNNVQLKQQLEDLKKSADGNKEKLDRLNELEKLVDEDEEKKMIADGKLEEVVERRIEKRTNKMRREYENQIKQKDVAIDAVTGERDEATGSFNKLMIDTSINEAINEVGGVRKGALQDIRARGRNVFKMRDGALTAMDEVGNIMYGGSGSDSLSPTEWLQGLLETAPHLFEGSSGAGGKGGRGTTGDGSGVRTLDRMDIKGFGNNLEAIAAGQVQIR